MWTKADKGEGVDFCCILWSSFMGDPLPPPRGCVFIGVCLFVCLLAGLYKNYSTDVHKIRWKGDTWAKEETIISW